MKDLGRAESTPKNGSRFADVVDLRPEQSRIVTACKAAGYFLSLRNSMGVADFHFFRFLVVG